MIYFDVVSDAGFYAFGCIHSALPTTPVLATVVRGRVGITFWVMRLLEVALGMTYGFNGSVRSVSSVANALEGRL